MITGFNTDIEYQGVTYHVQTEDKGLATPLILSLVYNGGTILASKRSPYDDLLLESFDEKILTERLQRQHKLICAAISSGRLEDLKQMTMKASARKIPERKIEETAVKFENPKINFPAIPDIIEKTESSAKNETEKKFEPQPARTKHNEFPQLDIPQPEILQESSETFEDFSTVQQTYIDLEQILEEERLEAERRVYKPIPKPIPKPKPKIWQTEAAKLSEEFIFEDVEIVEFIEDIEIISADAVEIIEEKSPSQELLEKLSRANNTSQPNSFTGELKVLLLSDDEFYSGDEKTLKMRVFRGDFKNGLGDAHIMVKILGSAFAPLLYHAKTDSNGMADVYLKMPVFDHGRAVLLIKAMSDGDEDEFRRIIKLR